MKKLVIYFVFYFIVNLTSLLQAYTSEHNIGIAAVVNNQIITKLQLKQRIKLAIISSNLPNTPQTYKELETQILNIMIDELIQVQFGETIHLKIEPSVIENALNDIEQQNNMQTGDLKKLLAKNNIPEQIMFNHLKASLTWRDYIRERYKENVQVSDAETNRSLDEFKVAKNTLRYNLFELVINYKDNRQNAIRTINHIVDSHRKGTPFPILAKQFSNSASANRGGHIGWISKDALETQIYEKIKNLKDNDISGYIDNGQSLTIYYVKEHLNPGQFGHSETLVSFKQILLPHNPNGFEFETRENLNRAKAIARTIKSCRIEKIIESNNLTVNNVENTSIQNLPPELMKILNSLVEGQASNPVLTEQGALIFVLCKKETTNPEEPTFDNIKDQLIDRKLQLIADREMRNRRKSAHIERRI